MWRGRFAPPRPIPCVRLQCLEGLFKGVESCSSGRGPEEGEGKFAKLEKKRTNRWEGIRTRRREIHSEFHVFLLTTHCAANKEVGRVAYNRESAFTVR